MTDDPHRRRTDAQDRTGLLLELEKPTLHPGIVADVSATLRRFPGLVDSAAGGLGVDGVTTNRRDVLTRTMTRPLLPVA